MAKPKQPRSVDALQAVLSTREGREVLMDIMLRAGLHASFPQPDNRDFLCGRQSVANDILQDVLTTDARLFTMMYNEKIERDETDDAGTQ